jgi:hypothetical protein
MKWMETILTLNNFLQWWDHAINHIAEGFDLAGDALPYALHKLR